MFSGVCLGCAEAYVTLPAMKCVQRSAPFMFHPHNRPHGVHLAVIEGFRTKCVAARYSDSANKAMKATPYTYTTPNGTTIAARRREKVGMEERTVEAASMVDVNKAYHAVLGKEPAKLGSGPVRLRREILSEMPHAAGIRAAKAAETEIRCPEAGTAARPCICARCISPSRGSG